MKKIVFLGWVLATIILVTANTSSAYTWPLPNPWISESYNRNHPELRDGEVFLTNIEPEELHSIEWKTKRMGRVAYDRRGWVIYDRHLVPVFVQKFDRPLD